MRKLVSLVALVLLFCPILIGQSPTKRYIYMSMPDAAQKEGRSGSGILVFDIDDGHKLVKRIPLPNFDAGTRGFAGSKAARSLFFSMSGGRVGRFDIEAEKVVWDKTFDRGADRSSVSMDGKKLYVPTGYWDSDEGAGLLVLNAENGELIKRITVGPGAHNSIVSLDGRYLFLGTRTALSVFDAQNDERPIHARIETGESSIFPYTIDSRNRYAYVSLGTHIGFDVVDVQTGKHLHRVYVGPELVHARTHGAGLTPDESELWISDQSGQRLYIFDATKMPPTPKGHVELSQGGHGWVTFSLDGRYAYSHAPDIFDVKTKKLVGTFKDENGQPVSNSKFIEVQLRDGTVVEVGNEFGLGRKYAAGATN